VFVDRDGTINPDLHYLADAARVEIFPTVAPAIRLLHQHGYLVLCVTNQSGIERGFYTEHDVRRIHERINVLLNRDGAGIDTFYYCPHAPESGCTCRKPGVELFERAQREWSVGFASSAIIGDRGLDVQAGERLGLTTAVVPAPGHETALRDELHELKLHPDIHASTFLGAALRILASG
jgi:D-glycero-D-manno-heptose 1,7-bisphosphate phosphatase